MSPAQRNLVALSLMAVGLSAMLAAGFIAWSAVGRWQAVAALRDAQGQLRHDRLPDARRFAVQAVAKAPDEAAAMLLALDPADMAAVDRLAALAPRIASRDDRNAVLAAVALARLQAGKPADVDLAGTGDGRLIAAMSAAAAGRPVGALSVDGEDPPHLQVQRVVLRALLRAAWAGGQPDEVRRHAGALLLIRPRAADAMVLRAICAATTPAVADAGVIRRLQEVSSGREALAAALAKLVPTRQAAIAAQWPAIVPAGAKP